MKKVIVLLAVLFGVYWMAHGVIPHNASQQAQESTQSPATKDTDVVVQQQVTPGNTNNDVDKMDTGSGDDIGTINEGDPANDDDPEADQGQV